MEVGRSNNIYLLLMYVYLKAYHEAITDFETAAKNAGYADVALLSVKEKYSEKIDRLAQELSA